MPVSTPRTLANSLKGLAAAFMLTCTLGASIASAQTLDTAWKPTSEQQEMAAKLVELREAMATDSYWSTLEAQIAKIQLDGCETRDTQRYLRLVAFDFTSHVADIDGIIPDDQVAEWIAAYESGWEVGVAIAQDLGVVDQEPIGQNWNDLKIRDVAIELGERAPELPGELNGIDLALQDFKSIVHSHTSPDVIFDVLDFLRGMEQMVEDLAANATVNCGGWEDLAESVVFGGLAGTLTGTGPVRGAINGTVSFLGRKAFHSLIDAMDYRYGDHDGDGVPNIDDPDFPVSPNDNDGDGVPNNRDRRKNNPDYQIAPWSEPPYVFITGPLYSSVTRDGFIDGQNYNPDSGYLHAVADFIDHTWLSFIFDDPVN